MAVLTSSAEAVPAKKLSPKKIDICTNIILLISVSPLRHDPHYESLISCNREQPSH
jgi:hypothetical protein